jgi:hypothetical protein
MSSFINEDDLKTFEGWLRFQAVDAAVTPAEQLEMWRDLFREVREASDSAPKVGSMKLRPGEHRYAVAVREGVDLWLTLWIRRSSKGDVYVFMPRGDRQWNPHASYHRDGTLHQKSYDHKFAVQHRQPVSSFSGTEHLGVYAGHGPKAVGAVCDPKNFSGVIEIEPGVLGPMHGNVAVDLISPGYEPLDLMMSNHTQVVRREFSDAVPHLVIRVFASNVK